TKGGSFWDANCANRLCSHFHQRMRSWKRNHNDGNESERDSQIVRKKTRWKLKGGSVEGSLILSTLCLLIIVPRTAVGNSPQYLSNTHCSSSPHGNGSILKCMVSPEVNVTISQSLISHMSYKFRHSQKSHKFAVEVTCTNTSLPSRFNFTEMSDYLPHLDSFSLTGCNFSRVGLFGMIPPYLTSLNLSHNHLDSLPAELFRKGEKDLSLISVDLTNNPNLTTLPKSLLILPTVQTLRISNNTIECTWIPTYLYPLYERIQNVIVDVKELNCKPKPPTSTTRPTLILTIYGALKAKHDEKIECQKVDKRCSCNIYTIQPTQSLQRENYPISFLNHGENMSVTLNVSCQGKNLTILPSISNLTRHLNVSHNLITSLDELRKPEYANLGSLVAEYNNVENIDVVEFTPFVKQFNVLGLRNNKIKSISARLLSVLLNSEVIGHGLISLEENYLECTCDTYYVKVC
ncbi:unnamed protein product, partial [Allacma fusca]